jgi:hypothetical protein
MNCAAPTFGEAFADCGFGSTLYVPSNRATSPRPAPRQPDPHACNRRELCQSGGRQVTNQGITVYVCVYMYIYISTSPYMCATGVPASDVMLVCERSSRGIRTILILSLFSTLPRANFTLFPKRSHFFLTCASGHAQLRRSGAESRGGFRIRWKGVAFPCSLPGPRRCSLVGRLRKRPSGARLVGNFVCVYLSVCACIFFCVYVEVFICTIPSL